LIYGIGVLILSGKSVSVHPKFGVNPTISVCLFCGESKNEIVLLGGDGYKVRNEHNGRYESAEAPMHMVLDTLPCDTCIQTWHENGIAFVEITPHKVPTGRTQSPYEGVDTETKMMPSGRYVVVKHEAAQKILSDYPHVDRVMEVGRCDVDQESFNHLFGQFVS